MYTRRECQRGEQAVKPDRPAGRLWRGAPGRRLTGDPPVVTTGATTTRWRCRTADPPRGAWWRAPLATRPLAEPARQRRGGVTPPPARPRRDGSGPTSGHCPVGEAPSATRPMPQRRGAVAPPATRPSPRPVHQHRGGVAPPAMRPPRRPVRQHRGGVAPPATRPARTGGRQFRGVPHRRCALHHVRRNSAAGASPQRRHALCKTGGRRPWGEPLRRGAQPRPV